MKNWSKLFSSGSSKKEKMEFLFLVQFYKLKLGIFSRSFILNLLNSLQPLMDGYGGFVNATASGSSVYKVKNYQQIG